MKQYTINKLGVISILLCLIVSIFVCIPTIQATSTESTGLTLTQNITNQGTFVDCGGYSIFSTTGLIIFYDNDDGSLAKTWTIPVSATFTKILPFNTTHIIVASNIYSSSTTWRYLLNVATLTYDSDSGVAGGVVNGIGTFFECNGIYYIFHGTGSNYWIVQQVYPTVTSVGSGSGLGDQYCYGATIAIPSETTNEMYIVTKTPSNNRFRIFEVNVVTPTCTLLGTSGIDNTYGDYVYFYGYNYDSDGTNDWIDVGIVYNNPTVNKDIYPQVIRFNSSYVGYIRTTTSQTSAVNLLRCISVSYTGIWDRTYLIDGDYQFYYVGDAYGMMLCPFEIEDLNTASPSISGWTPSVFGDNGVQWEHYYQSSNSIGGILAPTGIMWQIDYQNNKCVADKWASLNPSYSYLFSLEPTPLQIIASGTVLRAVCLQGQSYTYTGELYADGVRTGNGTYQVSTTGLSTNYYIETQGTYGTTSTTGSIVNGELIFTITSRTSAYVSIYEGIKVTVLVSGASQEFTHTFVWTTDTDEDGLAPSTTSPTQGTIQDSGGTGMSGTSGINLLNGGTFVGLMIVTLFTILLGAFAGRDGILAGLSLGIFLSCMFGLFPIYGILLSVVFCAILLFSHVSIGGITGGGTPTSG